jgi:L-methionine (R)-S-oxide reductase
VAAHEAAAIDGALILEQARALLGDESDAVANAANLSALIFATFPALNWAGFYFVRGDELVLGPFQGKHACTRIARGRGVCGAAWAQAETIVVPDVHAFPGHIACDSASNSEVAIPIVVNGVIAGVLDVDSPRFARFSSGDVALLEQLAGIYADRAAAGSEPPRHGRAS